MIIEINLINYICFILFLVSTSNASANKSMIPEIGGMPVIDNMENIDEIDECDLNDAIKSKIVFKDAPYVTWFYWDYEQKCNCVFVAVPIFAGTKNISFAISEDGNKIDFNYTWPTPIFNASELFAEELNHPNLGRRLTMNHPKIHSLTTHLLQLGITENSSPKGQTTISLPLKVQREVGSWNKKAIKRDDGNMIILLQLKGFQENITIRDADTAIDFN